MKLVLATPNDDLELPDLDSEDDSDEAAATATVRNRDRDAIEVLQNELDNYYTEMRKFEYMDIAEILLRLSAFSARASEVRGQIQRSKSGRAASFRTREIEPFLDECDRQFKIHSRLQAIREMEFRMSGGQV